MTSLGHFNHYDKGHSTADLKSNHTGFPNLSREILTGIKSSLSTDSLCVYELIIKKSILDITYNSRRERTISDFVHSFHREKTKRKTF